MVKQVIIMGAAGRDFHDYLTYFKSKREYRVVCFTAEQIPGIAKRHFPAALAGPRYPRGIPIHPEKDLASLIKKYHVDEVVLSYSDLSHKQVMHKASLALACGADFRLLSWKHTALKSKRKVISVCAVRTGCGKSQVSRKIAWTLRDAGKKVVVVRHPMPYGDLVKQRVQRFATLADLDAADCTIEEREEYEPHIKHGIVVYAGVDYARILKKAEQEADIIIWDGGNNDVPFYVPDIHIVVVDPHRCGHETRYHPGEENLKLADVVVINKMDSADKEHITHLLDTLSLLRPKPLIVKADSQITVDRPVLVKRKKVLVVEDGPTLTHGGMSIGAGEVISKRLKAHLVDPLPHAVGSIKKVYDAYPHLDAILPAMGYGNKQLKELEKTINNTPCDVVVNGSPVDLSRIIKSNKPIVRVGYELKERGNLTLTKILKRFKFIK